jgi:hypothetical protein
MTKDYHLTQEQVLEIAQGRFCIDDADGYLLTNIVNAALDKVLGEPVGKVADIAPDRFPPLHDFIFNAPAEAFQLGTKLYAPRRVK